MRGIKSQAMVLCAEKDNLVDLLAPPADSSAGDTAKFEGFEGVFFSNVSCARKSVETESLATAAAFPRGK